MSFVAHMPDVVDQISGVQSVISSVAAGGGGFEAVMQQVAALSDLAQAPAGSVGVSDGGTDMSDSYGWPLEEGHLSQAQLAKLGGTGALQAASYAAPPASYAASTMASGTFNTGTALGSAVPSSTVLAADVSAPATTQSWGQAIVADTQKYLGVPYQWGGTDPTSGVDCSGLVQDVFRDLGVSLPRTADEQSTMGTAVPSLAQAQPGDLLFFPGSDGTASDPGHVGIYIGNGQMIDAPYTGADVRVDPVNDAGTPTAIRRIASPATFAAPPAPMTEGTDGVTAAPAVTDGTDQMATGATTPATGTGTAAAIGAAATGAATYADDFAQSAATYGVPAPLLSAVAETESGFNPQATSSAGAEGLMQLMPSTASSLGVDPFNPAQAIDGAARLLAGFHQQFGSWSLAVAAYNAGARAVTQYSGVPPYAETQQYVQNVLARAGMEAQ